MNFVKISAVEVVFYLRAYLTFYQIFYIFSGLETEQRRCPQNVNSFRENQLSEIHTLLRGINESVSYTLRIYCVIFRETLCHDICI